MSVLEWLLLLFINHGYDPCESCIFCELPKPYIFARLHSFMSLPPFSRKQHFSLEETVIQQGPLGFTTISSIICMAQNGMRYYRSAPSFQGWIYAVNHFISTRKMDSDFERQVVGLAFSLCMFPREWWLLQSTYIHRRALWALSFQSSFINKFCKYLLGAYICCSSW